MIEISTALTNCTRAGEKLSDGISEFGNFPLEVLKRGV